MSYLSNTPSLDITKYILLSIQKIGVLQQSYPDTVLNDYRITKSCEKFKKITVFFMRSHVLVKIIIYLNILNLVDNKSC